MPQIKDEVQTNAEIQLLNNKILKLEETTSILELQNKILEERIEGKMAIAEHTNVFLDVVFILLSVVLWAITMQGWRNSKDIENERKQLRELLEKDREEVQNYKKILETDRENFTEEYSQTIEKAISKINTNKEKAEEGYKVMQEQYEQIINDIKGVSEYYLELVSISHEPDLSERVFEYERILKNSEKYHLSEEEKGKLYYYLSINLYELITKTPEAKDKIVNEWIKKASKYISSAISLGGKVGTYYYEKAKIEFEKYRLELLKTKDFTNLTSKIYEIEEYFEIAFQATQVEFYMFEEMINVLYAFVSVLEFESEKRIIYDLIITWCERAFVFDKTAYKEELEEIREEIFTKIQSQNIKLDN